MRILGNIIVILLMVLTTQACNTPSIDRKDDVISVSNGKELILKGRVSLPLPESYEKLLFDDYSIIISAPEYSVVYRWIDKEEVEFIGSEKSPYDFFRGALTNPSSVEEERFLEGLNSKVHQPDSPSSSLEFYYFDNSDGQQMYILSRSLSFAVEVTYKGHGGKYIDSVIKKSNIQ